MTDKLIARHKSVDNFKDVCNQTNRNLSLSMVGDA